MQKSYVYLALAAVALVTEISAAVVAAQAVMFLHPPYSQLVSLP
jgi:hypothetical protein